MSQVIKIIKESGMFIDGEWKYPIDRKTFEVYNPYNGELIGTLPEANAEDIKEIVASAKRAFEAELLSPQERYKLLSKTAELMERDMEIFIQILVLEVGKTRKEALAEVKSAIDAFILAAEESKRIKGEEIPISTPSGSSHRKFGVMLKAPSGPVCAISAYNAPLNQGAHKVAAAIAAGCSVVLKPSPFTPFHAIHLIEIMVEAGLPKGLVQLIYGGVEAGEALLAAEEFSRYMFTGSLRVGREISKNAGLRPTILEMGSNAPNIVHHDADIDQAVSACLSGYAIAGQVCTSVQRLYVHEDIFEKFAGQFVEKVKKLRVGDPADDKTDMGPVRNDQAAERFDSIMNEAIHGGAKILIGGKRNGRLIEPTVLADVKPHMAVYCEEIFLPIVNLIPYNDFDAILAESNNSPYGLQAGVFTSNLHLAFKAAKKLKVGGIMVNDASRYRVAQMAYGGVKGSGVGREGLPYAIDLLMDVCNVVFNVEN